MWKVIAELFKQRASFVILVLGGVVTLLGFLNVSANPWGLSSRGQPALIPIGLGVLFVLISIALAIYETRQVRRRAEEMLTGGMVYVLRHMERDPGSRPAGAFDKALRHFSSERGAQSGAGAGWQKASEYAVYYLVVLGLAERVGAHNVYKISKAGRKILDSGTSRRAYHDAFSIGLSGRD